MLTTPHATPSQESIGTFTEAIRGFEAAQAKLRVRRASASAHVIPHIDHSLELNERTLESLRRALATATEQIERLAESKNTTHAIKLVRR